MKLFEKNNKKEPKVSVEVFNGLLEKDAIIDGAKKEFSENEEIVECVLLSHGADKELLTKAKRELKFELNVSDEFTLAYLIVVSNEKRILKLTVIISTGLDESLTKLMEGNNHILRIQK